MTDKSDIAELELELAPNSTLDGERAEVEQFFETSLTTKERDAIDTGLAVLESKLVNFNLLTSYPEAVKAYARFSLGQYRHEAAGAILFDVKGTMIGRLIEIEVGAVAHVKIKIGKLTELCHEYGAAGAVLVHNHTSGICTPSGADIRTTKQISTDLMQSGYRLLDHIIVSAWSAWSFKQNGLLSG